MVVPTEQDGKTWYECEECGFLMEEQDEAERHEATCDGEEPSYLY